MYIRRRTSRYQINIEVNVRSTTYVVKMFQLRNLREVGAPTHSGGRAGMAPGVSPEEEEERPRNHDEVKLPCV